MEHLLYSDPFYALYEQDPTGIFIAVRLEPPASVDQLLRSLEGCVNAARAMPGQRPLVLDLRRVVGRVDPDFERESAKLRLYIEKHFTVVVTVVATPLGKLQTQRLAREDGSSNQIVSDLDEAIALATKLRAKKS